MKVTTVQHNASQLQETQANPAVRNGSLLNAGSLRARAYNNLRSIIAAAVALACLARLPASFAANVLPPTAKPHGYSLDAMASAVANFSISGNDLAFYPQTPFQILYRLGSLQDPTGHNTFRLRPGTYLYLKYFFIDDSAPIIGDWPADKTEAAGYIFGRDQIGAHNLQIVIDGKPYSLDNPGYIGGPLLTPDGSDHMIQIGAFISPLSVGTHVITARGDFDGEAFVDFVGFPVRIEITYTVIVR